MPINTFVPDYECIIHAFDAVKKIYKIEGNNDRFTGNRLVYFRGKHIIRTVKRRPKLKSYKRCKMRKIATKKVQQKKTITL